MYACLQKLEAVSLAMLRMLGAKPTQQENHVLSNPRPGPPRSDVVHGSPIVLRRSDTIPTCDSSHHMYVATPETHLKSSLRRT